MKHSTLNLASPILTAMHPGNPHGIRFANGDAGEGASGGTGQAPAGEPASTPPASDPAAPAGEPQTPAPGAPGDNLPDDPAALKAEIARLRRENGADRTNAKQAAADEARQQIAQDIAKALGLTGTDTPPDPAELTAQVQAAQQAARQSAIELAVFRGAAAHQGDPNALLDSRTFLAKVADLDPASAEFTTQVDAAIKAAVTDNPKLKTAPAVGASTADHAGGSGERRVIPPQSIARAVSAAYGG